jgi:hypothetical protein
VLLKAQREDVVAWLEAQRSSTGPDYASSPIHHLPTPVSTSPEPFPGVATHANFESFLKSDPLHSPVVPSLFLKSGHVPHVSSSLLPVYAFVILNFLFSSIRFKDYLGTTLFMPLQMQLQTPVHPPLSRRPQLNSMICSILILNEST